MKKLLFVALIGLLPLAPCFAQDAAPTAPVNEGPYEYVMVRTAEVINAMFTSEIVVAYGDGKTEVIELEQFTRKKWAPNTDKLHLVLSRLMSQGYEMVTSNGGAGEGYFTSTYFLRRRKQ